MQSHEHVSASLLRLPNFPPEYIHSQVDLIVPRDTNFKPLWTPRDKPSANQLVIAAPFPSQKAWLSGSSLQCYVLLIIRQGREKEKDQEYHLPG